jgi:hypothetical protein
MGRSSRLIPSKSQYQSYKELTEKAVRPDEVGNEP